MTNLSCLLRAGAAVLALGILSAGCTTSPLGRGQLILFPDDEVEQMGVMAFQELKRDTSTSSDRQANRYVRCIANAIVAELPASEGPWEVVVFADEAVNAFALPGRKIGVYTGLLKVAENQHQVATVIGHEVAHVLANHSNERLSTSFATETGLQLAAALGGSPSPEKDRLLGLLGVGAQVGILLPYGRKQESEADLLGLDYMARAGFDPRESVGLWINMDAAGGARPPEFLSTHPSSQSRIEELKGRMADAMKLYEQARARGLDPGC